MIVVVILAIVGTLAYPTYRNHATRARYTDAKVMLLQIMQRQREFFTNNNTYTTNLVAGGLGYADAGSGKVSSEQDLYLISASLCDGGATAISQCVELSAEPQGGAAGDPTFTYNSRNEKSPAAHW